MSYLSAFRAAMAGVLLLAIGLKAAPPTRSHIDETAELVAFFERNNFAPTTELVNEVPIVRASAAACQLQVARLSPDGSNRDLVQHVTAGQGRSFVVFHGTVYAQQPIFWTVLASFRSRFLRELGFADGATAALSVTANSSCDAEQLPWSELPGM